MAAQLAEAMPCVQKSDGPTKDKKYDKMIGKMQDEMEDGADKTFLIGKSGTAEKKLAEELQKYQVEKDAIKIRVEKFRNTKFADSTNDPQLIEVRPMFPEKTGVYKNN